MADQIPDVSSGLVGARGNIVHCQATMQPRFPNQPGRYSEIGSYRFTLGSVLVGNRKP